MGRPVAGTRNNARCTARVDTLGHCRRSPGGRIRKRHSGRKRVGRASITSIVSVYKRADSLGRGCFRTPTTSVTFDDEVVINFFTGLTTSDYQDVLRAIGLLLDQQRLRDVRIWEHEDGFVVQGRHHDDESARYESIMLTKEDLVELLDGAYGRRDA